MSGECAATAQGMSFIEVLQWFAYVGVILAFMGGVMAGSVLLARGRWWGWAVFGAGFLVLLVVGLMAPTWAQPPGHR